MGTTNNIVSNNGTWHNWMHPTYKKSVIFLLDSYNKHFNTKSYK